jgi:hypothetical protein
VTVPTRPEHPRGWQATPGHPIPRAARQPAANGLLLVMLVLVWFSPLSIVAWLVGQASAGVSASTSAPATAAPPGCWPGPVTTSSPRPHWGSPWTATCAAGAKGATWSRRAQLRGKAMAVVGAPGAGKTVTLLRLAYLAGLLGRKVCFVNCKGTDPTLVPALIAAYRLGNPQARIGCWPDTAMDMWRGSPVQVASRLLAVEQFTEPFYQRVASAGLRLALTAPDMPPVEGSDELLRRLDVDELGVLWEGRALQLKDIEAIAEHLPGARLRYADFFAALGGAFDRGR